MNTIPLRPHQTIGYVLARAVEYYGDAWYHTVTLIYTVDDGYLLLMREPR